MTTQAEKLKLLGESIGNKNTIGVVKRPSQVSGSFKNEGGSGLRKDTNPALTKEELDNLQLILEIAGLFPVVGAGADLINSVVSLMRGDFTGAIFNVFSAFPGVGDANTARKVIANPQKYFNALDRLTNNVLNKLPQKYADELRKLIRTLRKKMEERFGKGSSKPNSKSNSENNKVNNNNKKSKRDCPECPGAGKPVNPIQGCKVLTENNDTDFTLMSDLPLVWGRQYASNSSVGGSQPNDPIGWYGQGWSNSWGIQLHIKPKQNLIELVDPYGRAIPFPCVGVGKSAYSRFEDIRLTHEKQGVYRLTSGTTEQGDGINIYFEQRNAVGKKQGLLTTATVLYCTAQSDAYGNCTSLHYHQTSDKAHLPQYMTDCIGRVIKLEFVTIEGQEHNAQRLVSIYELTGLSKSSLAKLNKPHYLLLQPHIGKHPHILHTHISDLVKDGTLPNTLLSKRILVKYQYSDIGNLIAVYPDDQPLKNIKASYSEPSRRYEWYNHVMTAHHFKAGISSYYTYDDYSLRGKVLSNTISTGQTYHFDYYYDYTVVTECKNTPNERHTLYHFNKDKRWTGLTDSLGNRTTFVLDDYDRLTEIISPNGSVTVNQYVGDTLAATKQLTDYDPITKLPQWRTQQYLYDNNRLNELLDPHGNSTELAYDVKGQIKQITDANGNSTYIERDAKGRTTKQTLANGSSYQYEYNDKGELIRQTDCSGNPTTYQYDALGRITQITDAQEQTIRYFHDTTSHRTQKPTRILYPDGSQEHFVYDTLNRLTQHTDTKGQTTQYEYAIDDLPVKRIDALGHTLQYDYDNLRRLTILTNENGEQWTFEYDKADNLISETRFDGMVSHYDYDKNGQLVHQTDNLQQSREQQRHIYLQRDLIGQLTHKHSLDIVKHNGKVQQRHHKTKYQYDIAGQLIRATSPDASTHLDYDNIGQLISERLTRHHIDATVNEQTLTQTLTHEYDEIGNRINTTLPDGKVIKQAYYGSGHLYNQSIESNGDITEIRHSERNELHQETTRQQGDLLSSFGYDPMGRLTKQYSSSDKHIAIERRYSYDKLGQLTHISGQTRLGAVKGGHALADQFRRNHQYDYDKVGRLTAHKLTDFANHTGTTEVFAFDPASNRVPMALSTATATDSTKDNNKHIHKSGRPRTLTTHDSYITYTYDSHGRVLFKTKTPLGKDGKALKQSSNGIVGYLESLQLYYNANNELAKSIKTHRQGYRVTVTTTTYEYDAFGRRIAKHSEVQQQSTITFNNKRALKHGTVQHTPTQQHSTLMLWDGNRQAQEYTDTHVFTTVYEQDSFVPVARLVWLQDELLKSANDEIINTERESWENEPTLIPNVQIYHYHNDHLGTPNELTSQDGEVVWLADYEAWGNTAKVVWREEQLGQLQVSREELQPLRFQGQFIDQETGLHYNRFRYFDPDLGMFTTRDPIGLMGGVNTFQYAPNPTGWVDPFGLAKESVYRLVDDAGKTIYYGITGRDEYVRQIEHINKGKLFAKMEVLAKGLSHDEARSLEGALIRNRIPRQYQNLSVKEQLEKAGLINKNRGRDPTRWTSNDPLNDLKNKILKEPEVVKKAPNYTCTC